jgi:quercetin dioxygenase-like cupin family protein
MRIFRAAETPMRPADPASFAGPAQARLLATGEDGTPVHVYQVAFDAGGRTNWHTHSGAQWLLVVEGRIRVQPWQEAAQDVAAGDAVLIPPGEKHWHGATPGTRGVHLAVNIDLQTTWLEPVTAAEYGG